MQARVQAGELWSGDVPLRIPGQQTWVHIQAFPLFHPGTGERLGSAWIAQDITELRASEDALRAANSDLAQFRALVEASRDFIAIAGMDGVVRYVNPAGRELIGLPAETDVASTRIADYFTPEELVHARDVELPAVLEEGHWEGLSSLRHSGGEVVPVEVSSFVMREETSGSPFALGTVQHDIRERLAAEEELHDLATQREGLLSRLVDAQEAERATIAAGVHDDQIQALATVDLRLHVLRRKLSEQAPQLLDVLDPLQDSVAGALDRLRALIFELEPPDLDRGLVAALSWAAGELFRDSAIQVHVRGEEGPGIDAPTRSMAYRIVREALVNVRKHSGATSVEVVVSDSEGGLQVSVTDNGAGIGAAAHAAAPGHRGLTSMQDRAAVAGGRCEIGAGPDGGTRVCVWLPGRPTPGPTAAS
jgi:PAS domain S-box-containing protein